MWVLPVDLLDALRLISVTISLDTWVVNWSRSENFSFIVLGGAFPNTCQRERMAQSVPISNQLFWPKIEYAFIRLYFWIGHGITWRLWLVKTFRYTRLQLQQAKKARRYSKKQLEASFGYSVRSQYFRVSKWGLTDYCVLWSLRQYYINLKYFTQFTKKRLWDCDSHACFTLIYIVKLVTSAIYYWILFLLLLASSCTMQWIYLYSAFLIKSKYEVANIFYFLKFEYY